MLALLLGAAPLRAQDAYYWTETYGTYATLLGGMVVGKVPDLSATFYNPGRLAFVERPSVTLTTRVYQVVSRQLELAGTRYGENDLGTTGVKPSPSFAAGVLPVGDRKRWVLAYSYVTRQSDEEVIQGNEAIATPPFTGGQLYWNRSASEYWYGISAGYRLSPKTGLGGTLFGAYRSQSQRAVFETQSATTPPAFVGQTRAFSYYDVRLLAKFGISTQAGKWYLGAAVTTPGAHLFGSGEILTSQVSTTTPTLFAWRSQEGISENYKGTWSVSGGAARTINNVTGYFTTEYFAPVARTALLDADSVVPQDGRPAYDDDVYMQRQEVVNAGIGVEVRQSETRAIYAHFKLDQSARPRNSGVDNTYERWGRYHVGGGYAFRWSDWDLVAGLAYSWGGDKFTAGELDPPPPGIPLPPGATAQVKDRRLRVLFGFSVRF